MSNAADACDKKRFSAISSGEDTSNLGIKVYANREANTLTIEDRGIGMSKDELQENLGRIAESGTKRYLFFSPSFFAQWSCFMTQYKG